MNPSELACPGIGQPIDTACEVDPWAWAADALPWVLFGVSGILAVIFLVLWMRGRLQLGTMRQSLNELRGHLAARPAPQVVPAPPAASDAVVAELIAASDLNRSPAVSAQLDRVLGAAGVRRLAAAVGDRFDPTRYTAGEGRETADRGLWDTIAEVLQPGWATSSRVIRPPEVAVWMAPRSGTAR